MDPRDTSALIERLTAVFAPAADAEKAAAMSAYMRGKFAYLGIPTPLRRVLTREVLAGAPAYDERAVAGIALACWELPEREYRYFAVDLLIKRVKALSETFVPTLRHLVVTDSWWDTVDGLATRVAGPLVAAEPSLVGVMDEWIESPDLWQARVAILHQMHYQDATDTERLYRYCERRAGDGDFFIRKAIGWILRQYAKTDPAAVRAFVARTELSPLSKREALKNIGA
ncbi:DNA alkylation repair protein [Phytomonospora endophytica]|uniref:3-methyladenine DNA glycosylase AlkD n=1 Tax=Phytomonospora endophytica TaxID=714109 RepID=A0A841FDK6_9ACTN|nr:DNA alkylation repair protein [Phytomonospora endophytica]MBB6033894.1 3-methyladenine DNA glycosylase AlkD [Phytomonospora endophytica]